MDYKARYTSAYLEYIFLNIHIYIYIYAYINIWINRDYNDNYGRLQNSIREATGLRTEVIKTLIYITTAYS
jgi:hypothetical protein